MYLNYVRDNLHIRLNSITDLIKLSKNYYSYVLSYGYPVLQMKASVSKLQYLYILSKAGLTQFPAIFSTSVNSFHFHV